MDLSNLGLDLPPHTPVLDALLAELHRDLTAEFKNAAKSVAALYRLLDAHQSMSRFRGYLDAVDDVLRVVGQGGDVAAWARSKRAELTGEPALPPCPEDFSFESAVACPHGFRPGAAPVSVVATRESNRVMRKARSTRSTRSALLDSETDADGPEQKRARRSSRTRRDPCEL